MRPGFFTPLNKYKEQKENKMKVSKKKLKLKVWIVVFITIIFSMNAFSYIYHNGSGQGYTSGDDETAVISTLSIETYVIQGGGYFLEASSCIQSILNRVEMQDFNGFYISELEQLVYRAYFNIIFARMTYEQLIQLAESTPYEREFISKLKGFDYQSFLENNGLNAVVFNKVREYLEKGDITGSFKHTYSNLCALEDLLTTIKKGIAVNQTPELSLLWKLNETCAESSIFGSYAARIYHVIK
jgi:hypothetical protein